MASFAQYYFCILHPFYERIGRTSEDLIFLLFQQGPAVEPRYISQTGWRESPLAKERQEMINSTAYQLNKKIASFLGVGSEGVERTPDIYREITRKYFPSEFERIYSEKRDRPFYYEHPIGVVLKLYYLAMESIVYNEMISFDLDNPHQHIVKLGEHLRDKGFNKYIFQKQNRGNQQENLSVEQIIGATLSLSNTQPQH